MCVTLGYVRLGNLYYTGEPIASGYYKGTQKGKYSTDDNVT